MTCAKAKPLARKRSKTARRRSSTQIDPIPLTNETPAGPRANTSSSLPNRGMPAMTPIAVSEMLVTKPTTDDPRARNASTKMRAKPPAPRTTSEVMRTRSRRDRFVGTVGTRRRPADHVPKLDWRQAIRRSLHREVRGAERLARRDSPRGDQRLARDRDVDVLARVRRFFA